MRKLVLFSMAILLVIGALVGLISLSAQDAYATSATPNLTPDELELCYYLSENVDGSGYNWNVYLQCIKALSEE